LICLGVVPRKSRILECPDVPTQYIPDFFRGVMDGDGSVECGRHNRINIYTSSKKFADGLNAILKKISIESKQYMDNRGFYTVRITKLNDIYRLCNLMYSDTTTDLFLTRKYDKAIKIMDKAYCIKTNKGEKNGI